MMTAQSRLKVCALMLVVSILYGWVVITQGEDLALTIGVGYSVVILTAMAVVNTWKRP